MTTVNANININLSGVVSAVAGFVLKYNNIKLSDEELKKMTQELLNDENLREACLNIVQTENN